MLKLLITYIILSTVSFVFIEPELFQETEIPKDSTTSFTFSGVGDIMCHSTQFNYARVEKDSFDFKPVFSEIRPYLKKDVVAGNLETVFAGDAHKYTGYPTFNTPDALLEGLRYAGFNLLYTANNHSYDRGKSGLKRTMKMAEKFGMETSGTNLSQSDRDSIKVKNINGIKTVHLAYSYSTNGIALPENESYLVNQIDTTQIRKDIAGAKEKEAELVIVYFHFGTEYKTTPSLYQREIVNKTIESGADIIIGSHPHVVQPVKRFTSSKSFIDTGVVAYSLGNFISNQRWRYSDGGIVFSFSVEKDLTDNSIHLKRIEYLPFWVFKGVIEGDSRYVVLPEDEKVIEKYESYFSSKDIKNMNRFFMDTDSIVTSHERVSKTTPISNIPKLSEEFK